MDKIIFQWYEHVGKKSLSFFTICSFMGSIGSSNVSSMPNYMFENKNTSAHNINIFQAQK